MTYEELQALRERLLQASEQRARSKFQEALRRVLARLETRLRTHQRPEQATISEDDDAGRAA